MAENKTHIDVSSQQLKAWDINGGACFHLCNTLSIPRPSTYITVHRRGKQYCRGDPACFKLDFPADGRHIKRRWCRIMHNYTI